MVMSMGMTVVMIMVMPAVTMIVRVIMVMARMIVVAVIMMAVTVMIMTMRSMTATGIRSTLGIERRFNDDHTRAEAAHHVLDHMIAADAKALADDLCRQVTIPKMPGDPHQMMRIGAADLHQRFGRRDHLDESPVFQHQGIAAAQGHGFLQVQQEFQPSRTGHGHAAPVPVVETEDHRVGSPGPTAGRANLRRADHDGVLIVSGLRLR